MLYLAVICAACVPNPTILRAASPSPAPTVFIPSSTPRSSIKLTGTLQPAVTKTKVTTLPASATPTAAITATACDMQLIVAETSLSGLEISFWYPWTGDTAQVVEELVDEFNHSNSWGIRVNSQRHSTAQVLFQDVIDQAGTGTFPDIAVASQEQASAWQDAGIKIVALDTYIHNQRWGITQAEVDDFMPPLWKMRQSATGLQLGIPALQTAHVLFYNATWARELGFTQAPVTADEFLQQSCKAAYHHRDDGIKSNDGTGGWLVAGDVYSITSWIQAFGGSLTTGVEQKLHFSSPETAEALLFIKNLERQGCAWIGKDDQPFDNFAQSYFTERYALMISGDLADIPSLEKRLAANNNTDRWEILPYPVKGAGGSAAQRVLLSGTGYYLVESTPARQLASWVFVRWLAQNAQSERLVRASLTLPSRNSMLPALKAWAAYEPQWYQAAAWISSANLPPAGSQWALAMTLLEDGAQQAVSPDTPSDQIPAILDRIDQLLSEMVNHE